MQKESAYFYTFSNYFDGLILVVSISDSHTPVKSKVEEVSRTGDIIWQYLIFTTSSYVTSSELEQS